MGTQTGERRYSQLTVVFNTLAILTPALWVGGVPFASQGAFALLTCVAAWTVIRPASRRVSPSSHVSLRHPKGLLFFAALSAVTVLWSVPIPPALHELLFPKLTALRRELLPAELLSGWSPISLAPGQTLAEAARIAALGLLFFSCRQVPRVTVWYAVLFSGGALATIGIIQFSLGIENVLGLYTPVDRAPEALRPVPVLTSTFVNPNHQASYFLVTIGACMALVRRGLGRMTYREPPNNDRLSRIVLLSLLGSLAVAALMLTYSRAAMIMAAALVGVSVYSIARSGAMTGRIFAILSIPLLILSLVLASFKLSFGTSWSELASLTSPEGTEKLTTLLGHKGLLRFSHTIGIGRGAASDLLPVMAPTPSGRTMTHIESMPIVILVEYGLLLGTVVLASVLAWFITAFSRRRDVASALVLATLAALCCQNFVDFNLEFNGVSAPAVALASTVSPVSKLRIQKNMARRAVKSAAFVTIVLFALSAWAGGSWASQRTLVSKVRDGRLEFEQAIRRHPFDARLHLYRARSAARSGDMATAKRAAESARRLEPAAIEPHLLVGQIEQRMGNPRAARRAYQAALSQIIRPPSPEFVTYLAEVLDPEQLAAVTPRRDEPFFLLAHAMIEQNPRHVLSMTRTRAFETAPDPEALVLRIRAATILGDPLLATSEALHLIRVRPTDFRSYQLYARSIRVEPSQSHERKLQRLLTEVLTHPSVVEERRLTLLLLESALQTRDLQLIRASTQSFEAAPPPSRPRSRADIRWQTQLLSRAAQALDTTPATPAKRREAPAITNTVNGDGARP